MTVGQIVDDALTATSAEGASSQVIDNIFTGTNYAAAISGEAGASMTDRAGLVTRLKEPLTIIDPDSGDAQFAEVDASAPFGVHGASSSAPPRAP